MSHNAEWARRAKRVCMPNLDPLPLALVAGSGRHVRDADGCEYLDMTGGAAVLSVGHGHPALASALGTQAATIMHGSNLFHNVRAIELAEELVGRTPFERVFLCNSGAEANEALIKLARRYHHERGTSARQIVSAAGSFHGRTMGALSLTGADRHKVGFAPLLDGVVHVPYDDVDALDAAVGHDTAAVILETIQVDAGMLEASCTYLRAARSICDRAGALLFFDEVQTGYGRTGRFLSSEWSGVVPDACSLGKGAGGGFPLGIVAAREAASAGLPAGSHATTFGGNPLACAAGLAVLRIFDDEHLVANARAMGDRLRKALLECVSDARCPSAVAVRGRGLLAGLVLGKSDAAQGVVRAMRDRGVLLSRVGGQVVRFSPALNVTAAEVDEALDALVDVVRGDLPHDG